MSKKDIFGDDIDQAKDFTSFEELFAKSEQNIDRKLKVGDTLRAELLSIGKEESFVSTGTPVDGMIFTRDLLDENKQVKYTVGDIIEVVVTANRGGEIRVVRKGAKGALADSLEDAYDMELPVEGRVTETVNGGFRVSIQGKMAFCPISQIDLKFVKDTAEYIDRKFEFLITQFDPKGRNLVVSRRQLLELEKAESEGTFMQKNEAGAILEGRIVRLERFGAFVELAGGVEGLVHVSELCWSRVHDPKEVVSVGQAVIVKLLKTEEAEGGKLKISLSIKQADGDSNPWATVGQRFPVGAIIQGKVEKKEVYGLFVNLAPGITGLLPKSKWRETLDGSAYENKKRGDDVLVQIDQILMEEKKISLGLPRDAEDNTWRQHTTSTSGFGSLGDALKGLNIKAK